MLTALLGVALARECPPIHADGGCLTVQLGALTARARAGDACALHALGSLPGTPNPPPPLPGGKAVRDGYGAPNAVESENFVVRWGQGFDADDAQQILDDFEHAWSIEVTEMEHPEPLYADVYKFNVYIGDTGGGTPSSYGAAGYYYTDREGYPMIVLNRDTVSSGYGLPSTTAHEFYHAVQAATAAYGYEGEGAWYWEATATWIESEVWPNDPAYVNFIYGYSFFPHLALNTFDYPDTGALVELHQYGAFIFPRYLAEIVGDWRIVRDSWTNSGGDDDPLEVIDRILRAEHGTDLDAAFGDFAARNVAWDYEHGDWYAEMHAVAEDYYPDDSERVFEVHQGSSEGEQRVSVYQGPERYGTLYIRLDEPEGGPDVWVGFTGDDLGEEGSPATWAVSVVSIDNERPEYFPLDWQNAEGGAWIRDIGSDDEVWLVVSPTADRLVWGEGFGFDYTLTPGDADGPPADSAVDTGEPAEPAPKACGCTGAPAAPSLGLSLLALAHLARRRSAAA